MAASYCTTADVEARSYLYKQDIAANAGIGQAAVAAIADASERVRAIMRVAYDPAVIDAYGVGSYPQAVVNLTALMAVRSLFLWDSPANAEQGRSEKIDALNADIYLWEQVIRQGALVDLDGEIVPTRGGTRLDNPEPTLNTYVTALYTRGPRG